MLLTRRAFFLLLLTALFLVAATFESAFLYVALAYVVLLFTMVLFDRQLTPRPNQFTLSRVNDPRLSLGAENRIVVRVENRGTRAVRAIARDEFPVQFHADRNLLTSTPPSGDGAAARGSPLPMGGGLGDVVSYGETTSRPSPKFATTMVLRDDASRVRVSGGEGVRVSLRPRETVELVYHVRPPRRGDYAFGDLNLRWWGVLGLIIRQARYPAAAPVKVYPNLLDIRKYELQARKGQLTELGLRQTRMLGSGTEFERLREYQRDDEFRKIDWKATARRGKPVSREFETERSQNIIALLDTGRLMRPPVSDPLANAGQPLTKLDYAVNAVLMLSYVAGLRGDRVGLLAFADHVTHYLQPRAGRGQFYKMLALLYAVDSQPVESDYVRAFTYLGAKHKKRSLLVIFTDLASGMAADTLVKQVAPLYPRHLPLLVAIGDPTVVELANRMPRDSVGVYERAVAEQLLDERTLTLEKLRQRGVMTLDVPANQLSLAVVNRYLELKARGRI